MATCTEVKCWLPVTLALLFFGTVLFFVAIIQPLRKVFRDQLLNNQGPFNTQGSTEPSTTSSVPDGDRPRAISQTQTQTTGVIYEHYDDSSDSSLGANSSDNVRPPSARRGPPPPIRTSIPVRTNAIAQHDFPPEVTPRQHVHNGPLLGVVIRYEEVPNLTLSEEMDSQTDDAPEGDLTVGEGSARRQSA